MSAMVVVGAVWTALALGFALLLGATIRLAGAEHSRTSDRPNFAVDGDPFDAPVSAAPMFATATAPSAGTSRFTRRCIGEG